MLSSGIVLMLRHNFDVFDNFRSSLYHFENNQFFPQQEYAKELLDLLNCEYSYRLKRSKTENTLQKTIGS